MTAWVKNLLVIVIKSVIYGLLYALGFKHTGGATEAPPGDSDTAVTPLEAPADDEQSQE